MVPPQYEGCITCDEMLKSIFIQKNKIDANVPLSVSVKSSKYKRRTNKQRSSERKTFKQKYPKRMFKKKSKKRTLKNTNYC